jgi:hypothetical protein
VSITLTEELAEQVKSRLKAIASDSSAKNVLLQRVATETGALPLHYGIGGGLALKPTGEIIEFSWDDPKDIETVEDPRLVNMALFQGSEKYPELRVLIPTRPPTASTCPDCEGTGYIRLDARPEIRRNIVCYCGGIGWLP